MGLRRTGGGRQLFERFGSYYNGRLNELRIGAAYRANERLAFSLLPQWNRFRLPW